MDQTDRGVFEFLWTEEDQFDDEFEVLGEALDLVLEGLHGRILLEFENPNYFDD